MVPPVSSTPGVHSSAPPPRGMRWRAVPLVAAVALAFADASVVALALPDLYGELDTSIVGVSWVLTTYALAVAVTAVPVALAHRRVRPLALVVAGATLFAASSLAASVASGLAWLLVARGGQGVGATLLLAGSLPVLTALVDGERRARRWWALAGAVGTAAGPALGGVLTQLFDWRAIFYVQAPVVAAAILVSTDPTVRAARREGHVHGRAGTRRRDVAIANIGFALVFAALVAALFLGVLLAIEVWRYQPLQGALLVSALPLGMVLGRTLHAAPPTVAAGGGAAMLSVGLAGLALVPGERAALAAVAFALCGVGFDLVHEVLDGVAVPADGPAVGASAVSVGARHAGLVVGLALTAPLLSASLDAGIERATLGATRAMLEADLPLSDKIPVTWALRTAIDAAPRGQVPDLAAEFDQRGAEDDAALARARDDLMSAVSDAMTRAFRPAFALAAGLALAAAVPTLAVAWSTGERRPSARRAAGATAGVGAGLVVGAALLATMVVAGARDVGEYDAADPCTADPDPFPGGDGMDASVQRIGLSALNGAACELGTTRERLVLSLDPDSGYDDVTWDRATAEEALRVGAQRAIDDADERDAIPGVVASALRFVVDRAPIGWLVDRFPLPD